MYVYFNDMEAVSSFSRISYILGSLFLSPNLVHHFSPFGVFLFFLDIY